MARDSVAHRYAAALFLTAKHRGELEALEADARAMCEVLEREPRLMRFLGSPEIRDDKKEAVLKAALSGSSRPTMLQFFFLMMRKHRIAHIADVLAEFIVRAEDARGIQSARVTTAVPLAAELASALTASLESLTGKKIRLERELDPGILGGAVVRIGDQILDGSVRGRLTRLREELVSVRVH